MNQDKSLREILRLALEEKAPYTELPEYTESFAPEEWKQEPEPAEIRQPDASDGYRIRRGEKLLERVLLPWMRKSGDEVEELVYTPEQEPVITHPTELLCRTAPKAGRLVYQGEKGFCDWKLEKDSFLIGKKQQEVDGYLPEATVSRVHARIQQSDGDCYLEDMNSTNGTFLNGERLEYHQKARLEQGDRIAFGTVEYQFEWGSSLQK
jgi:hypothetical protein